MLFGLFLASLLTMKFVLGRDERDQAQLGGEKTKETSPEDATKSVLALARAVGLYGKGARPEMDPAASEQEKRQEA